MPDFIPHPLFVTGDLQTLATRFYAPQALPGDVVLVSVGGGDLVAVVVNEPAAPRPGNPVLVLAHGMTGSSASAYMLRMAREALARGYAVVRLNWRNAGEGAGLSRLPYHSGRSADLRAVLDAARRRFPGSPLAVIGYSLGGNVTLKLAGELAPGELPELRAVAAVAAPIDLAACADALARPRNFLYDQYFVRGLVREAHAISAAFPAVARTVFPRRMTVRTFDDVFTAPRSGFTGAADYYARSSSKPLLPAIRIPTLLVTAQDDPFVPFEAYRAAELSPAVETDYPRRGGHCGFISRGPVFWAEARCLGFVARHLP